MPDVVLLKKPSIFLAFEDMSCMCWFHFRSLLILTPRSFWQVKGLTAMSANVYWLMVGWRQWVNWSTPHLDLFKSILQSWHDCRISLSRRLRTAWWHLVLSANIDMAVPWETLQGRSFTWIRKRIGARIAPLGMPDTTGSSWVVYVDSENCSQGNCLFVLVSCRHQCSVFHLFV